MGKKCLDFQNLTFRFPLVTGTQVTLYHEFVKHIHECQTCEMENLKKTIKERGFQPEDYCCPYMGEKLTDFCPDHPNPWECPDRVIFRTEDPPHEYGLPIRDGGTSYIKINFCPWCGETIPKPIKP